MRQLQEIRDSERLNKRVHYSYDARRALLFSNVTMHFVCDDRWSYLQWFAGTVHKLCTETLPVRR